MSDASPELKTAQYAAIIGQALVVALFTGADVADEVVAAGYARQVVVYGAEVTPGAGVNEGAVSFGPLAGAGVATHFRVLTAAGVPQSIVKALNAPVAWADGGTIELGPGSLTLAVP